MLIIRPLVIVHTTDMNILDLLNGQFNKQLFANPSLYRSGGGVEHEIRYTVSRVWAEEDVPIYSSKNSPLSHDLNEKRGTAGTGTSQSRPQSCPQTVWKREAEITVASRRGPSVGLEEAGVEHGWPSAFQKQ